MSLGEEQMLRTGVRLGERPIDLNPILVQWIKHHLPSPSLEYASWRSVMPFLYVWLFRLIFSASHRKVSDVDSIEQRPTLSYRYHLIRSSIHHLIELEDESRWYWASSFIADRGGDLLLIVDVQRRNTHWRIVVLWNEEEKKKTRNRVVRDESEKKKLRSMILFFSIFGVRSWMCVHIWLRVFQVEGKNMPWPLLVRMTGQRRHRLPS